MVEVTPVCGCQE